MASGSARVTAKRNVRVVSLPWWSWWPRHLMKLQPGGGGHDAVQGIEESLTG
jgi:hypothetical protein